MENNKTTPADRFPAFDNLRSLMVLLVLFFHSGASYGSAVDFWPFHESNPSILIDIFMLLGDTFIMAILFFIAGYFAIPSANKHGGRFFLINKIKRVTLPWIVIISVLLPSLDYIHYYSRSIRQGLQTRSFIDHWLLSLKEIGRFRTGWLDMSSYIDMTEQFYQRYMWFLSLLFLFFLIFIIIYTTRKSLFNERKSTDKTTVSLKKTVFPVLAFIAFITILLFAAVRFLIYPEFMGNGWFSTVSIIQCQMGKLIIYAGYFSLGCYAYSRQWFTNEQAFGRPWGWILFCFLLFGANMMMFGIITKQASPSFGLRIAFVVLYPLWALSFLGSFISIADKYLNRSNRITREIASNSYNMYLAHYIFPMTLPLLLSSWTGGPVLLKFTIVAVITILASFGISRYIMKPVVKFLF